MTPTTRKIADPTRNTSVWPGAVMNGGKWCGAAGFIP